MDATIVLGHVTGDNNYTKECEDKEFLKWANPGLFLFIFVRFTVPIQMTIIQFEQYKLKKASMVWLVLKPGAAEWKAQTNPLSYGGTPWIANT